MTVLPYLLLCSLLLDWTSGFLQPNVPIFIHKLSLFEKPKWLDDAMGEFKEEETGQRSISLTSGIAGFSIDPDVGFVAILANNDKRWTPVLISTVDKDRVKSPEALTCVQLAGGLDLGTAVFPPDQLAKLVAEGDNDKVQHLRRRVSLSKVLAVPSIEFSEGDDDNNGLTDVTNNSTQLSSTPERDQMIKYGQNKVFKAIQSLPGLNDVTLDQVFAAMQMHANDEGNVDREAFSNILEYLRNPPSLSSSSLSKVKFELLVNILNDDGVKQKTVFTDDAMVALGLSMRYKVKVDTSDDCQLEEESALLERFPVFQSKYELYEEAKLIEGFIPNTFNKAALDNG